MKQTWDKFGTEMRNLKTELETLLEMVPLSEKFRKQTARINKNWNNLKKVANEMDTFIAPVKSVKVASALLNDAEFTATWKFWKDYLNEQHGIVMRSRAELMALKRLMDITKEKPAVAIHYLEFAMSRMDKNFYKVHEKEDPTPKPGEPGAKLTVVMPSQYSPPPSPEKPNSEAQKQKGNIHQKTIQEEISEFKKAKRQKTKK